MAAANAPSLVFTDGLEVVVEEASWDVDALHAISARCFCAVIEHLQLEPFAYELAILATNDRQIAALNAQFRQKDQQTNVLSWPAEELRSDILDGSLPPKPNPRTYPSWGDIALAYETCKKEAVEAEISFENHLSHLIVHGILHLLGYDHQTDKDADVMESTEITILAGLGIVSPYAYKTSC